jgi:hypothetical protein
MLLKAGADHSVVNKDGQTPGMLAAQLGRTPVAQIFAEIMGKEMLAQFSGKKEK